jgi:hypothetical protein
VQARKLVDQLLDESAFDGDSPFVTLVKQVFISGAGENVGSIDATATVTWTWEPEYRSWGIKGTKPTVSAVQAKWSDEDYNIDEPQATPRELHWNGQSDWKVEIESRDGFQLSSDIAPTGVDIDLSKKSITVTF